MADYRKRKPEVAKRNRQSPEKRYAYTIKRSYGLDETAFTVLKEQYPNCGICSTSEDLVVDHCHTSGQVRGRLCRKCNLGLGGLGDTETALINALLYLRKGVK